MILEEIFFGFFPYKITPLEKNGTQRYEIFSWPKKVEKIKKSLQNGHPDSQNARNRSGNKICLLLRAPNRPLDGVKGQKVVKNPRFFGSGPPNRVEITRDPRVFSLAREYLEVGERFSYTV